MWRNRLLAALLLLPVLAVVGLFVASDRAEAEKKTWKWGFVDGSGAVAVPLAYEGARRFVNGRAVVKVDGLWGFIDRDGTPVVEPRFVQLCDYGGDQLTCAQKTGTRQWGYIDDSGAWVIEPRYAVGKPMVSNRAVVGSVVGIRTTRISSSASDRIVHYGLIDRTGAERVPIRDDGDPEAWTAAGPIAEGHIPVQVGGGLYGYTDLEGTFVLEPHYRTARAFEGGVAPAGRGGGWGLVDKTGAVVVREQAGFAEGASEGLIAGPFHYYDLDGNPVGEPWEIAGLIRDGRGPVFRDEHWGYVDSKATVAIEPRFREVTPFAGDRALAAESDGRHYIWGIIDRDGEWVVKPRWRGIDKRGFSEGLVAVGVPPPAD